MIGSAAVGGVTDESETITLAVRMMISQTVFVIAGVIMMIFLARVFKTRFIGHTSSLTIYAVSYTHLVEGYIYSKEKVGYFVDVEYNNHEINENINQNDENDDYHKYKYDFSGRLSLIHIYNDILLINRLTLVIHCFYYRFSFHIFR